MCIRDRRQPGTPNNPDIRRLLMLTTACRGTLHHAGVSASQIPPRQGRRIHVPLGRPLRRA
eukprot:2764830-Alexandrium_andersonii.AAC.1